MMTQDCISGRIKLKDVSRYIGLEDIKSIEKWCNSHDVIIYVIGNRRYVWEQQVIDAIEKEFVEAVRRNMPNECYIICKKYVSTRTLEDYSFSTATYTNPNQKNKSDGNYPEDVIDFINNI